MALGSRDLNFVIAVIMFKEFLFKRITRCVVHSYISKPNSYTKYIYTSIFRLMVARTFSFIGFSNFFCYFISNGM
ncbi:hypothetical protein NERG_00684 [Nematocida ausubeli]|uniref:Uncharacterized protein n=1 Tax=Nematocida ausubeli (strain ATCC PRA-371 / ERTm2) TaxID=1913371 RepID=H8ZAT5_NEMA1|nr:hypothetical protein NERG_00684 [Nematocida ausubeli]